MAYIGIGKTIAGKFRILELLGEGGMGLVYRAIQEPIGREVALKILHPNLVRDEIILKRFLREAKAASLLTNPNSVVIHDFGQTEDGTLYIAMEYLQGEDLGKRLEKGPVSYLIAIEIVVQICRALSEAHKKGIIHRDLKPENIILSEADDGSLLVKVLDFGIAKMLASDGNQELDTVVTQANIIIGTPRYMSPEQAKGVVPTPESDLYSLGIIMYEAITGKPPFDSEDPILLLGMHIKDTPIPISQIVSDLPPAVSDLIMKLLSKDPKDRYPTAYQVAQILRPYIPEGHFNIEEITNPEAKPSPASDLKYTSMETLTYKNLAKTSSYNHLGKKFKHKMLLWIMPLVLLVLAIGFVVLINSDKNKPGNYLIINDRIKEIKIENDINKLEKNINVVELNADADINVIESDNDIIKTNVTQIEPDAGEKLSDNNTEDITNNISENITINIKASPFFTQVYNNNRLLCTTPCREKILRTEFPVDLVFKRRGFIIKHQEVEAPSESIDNININVKLTKKNRNTSKNRTKLTKFR